MPCVSVTRRGVDRNPALQELAAAQFSELQKPTYTILCATAEAAVDTVREYLETHEPDTDFVFLTCPEPSTMTVC